LPNYFIVKKITALSSSENHSVPVRWRGH